MKYCSMIFLQSHVTIVTAEILNIQLLKCFIIISSVKSMYTFMNFIVQISFIINHGTIAD